MEDTRLDIAATAENLKEIRQFVRNYIDKCQNLDERLLKLPIYTHVHIEALCIRLVVF